MTAVSAVISVLLPPFAIVGAVLGVVGVFLPSDNPLEKLINKMNGRFDELDSKLDNLLNVVQTGFDEAILRTCDANLETIVVKHIVTFKENLRYMKRARTSGLQDTYRDRLID